MSAAAIDYLAVILIIDKTNTNIPPYTNRKNNRPRLYDFYYYIPPIYDFEF